MQTPPPPPAPDAIADPGATGVHKAGSEGFYRYDLDGLRGIAIALVAVFHIWFGRVSGGVDVFLALSGFFFGGKVIRAALNPAVTLSPVAEVIRLIRRLVPALVVVLAGCAVLTILVQPETRWETFADQSLASLGYYQNWELANTASDYLRAGEAVSPLQHIWSMSVQGQFYVSFLVLIAGLAYRVPAPVGRPVAHRVPGGADRVDGGLVRVRDHRASAGPGGRLLQQLRARLGAVAGGAGRRAGHARPLADVAADGVGHGRAGRCAVLRGADRRRARVPRPVGPGAGRRRHADDPRRSQPAWRSRHGWPVAAAQSAAGDAPAGGAGRHGVCAVPLALAAADLLAVLQRPQARRLHRRRGAAAGVRCAGVSDQPARRGPAALPRILEAAPRRRRPIRGRRAWPGRRWRWDRPSCCWA